MLISFTGAQSSGKTTLLEKMVNDAQYRKCSFVKEVTRKVRRMGLNINELGDNETQLFILSEHLYNHHLVGCNVLDRCIVDGWVYTKYLTGKGKVDNWVFEYADNLLNSLIQKLDIIFYTDPDDVPLIDDNIRSVNLEFRNDIINIYNNLLERSDVVASKITKLSGSVSTRLKTISQTIKNYEHRQSIR